ncbi:MAG: hypothetical protein RLT05_05185 [Bauldia litoralis]
MEPRLTSNNRSARELEGAQRRSGRSWGGNRPGQWAVLAVFVLALAAVAATLALIA